MYDFIRGLISNPYYVIISIFFIWGLLYLILIRLSSPKEIFWVYSEYIWIGAGIVGLLTYVHENKKDFLNQEIEWHNANINQYFTTLSNYVNSSNQCISYHYTGSLPKEEFDIRIKRSDEICRWIKQFRTKLDSIQIASRHTIISVPPIELTHPEEEFEFQQTQHYLSIINSHIEDRAQLMEEANHSNFKKLRNSLGIFALILAVSLRLTIVSKKIRELRSHIKST